jgi:hypothetical protein
MKRPNNQHNIFSRREVPLFNEIMISLVSYILKMRMNTAIEFYFPEMEYLHDTAENLFRFCQKILTSSWNDQENEFDNLYDKIPPEKKFHTQVKN